MAAASTPTAPSAGGNLTNVTIDSNTFAHNNGGSGTTTYEAAIALEASHAGEQSNFRITNDSFTYNGKALLVFNATNILFQQNTVMYTQDKWERQRSIRRERQHRIDSVQHDRQQYRPRSGRRQQG